MRQPSKEAKAQPSRPNRSGAGFGILLSLLIASAAAISSYWTWQQSHIRDEVQDGLENGVSQLLGAIDKQREEISEYIKRDQQQQHQYNLLQQRLITLESKFAQANRPPKANRWSVAEALYLINIAEHHYRLEHNSTMARSALERTRELLLEHGSTDTTPVINSLSQLIAQLEKDDGKRFSRQIAQLEALAKLIPGLPVANNALSIDKDISDSDFSLRTIEGWRHYGEALRHDIQQLVRITPPSDPEGEKSLPITADIYPLIRQQLALKIDLAQLALMGNNPLYITSAKEIMELLGNYFDRDSEIIGEQLAILEQMVTTGETELTDIDFDLLRQHLATISE
ncbi:MAG: hypothetical protein GQ470_06615 [Gammaproteobacteria bacterium]|nr:hypothetical protein [Gammaproteobacteria bacterium]